MFTWVWNTIEERVIQRDMNQKSTYAIWGCLVGVIAVAIVATAMYCDEKDDALNKFLESIWTFRDTTPGTEEVANMGAAKKACLLFFGATLGGITGGGLGLGYGVYRGKF